MTTPAERLRQYKSIHTSTARELRRRDVLERQRHARRALTDHLRELVLTAFEGNETAGAHASAGELEREMDTESGSPRAQGGDMEVVATQPQSWRRFRSKRLTGEANLARMKLIASQFSVPEWLIEVPTSLNGKHQAGEGWFVMARPEGNRCLVFATGGNTITRLQNGDVLERFASGLPNGGLGVSRGKGCTILDCVHHELDQTYYVLDLVCWNGFELYDCTAEFRLFFLRSKYQEEDRLLSKAASPRIVPLLYHECDAEGLKRAYRGPAPFVRDGLVLLLKGGYYVMGLSPLALAWKDEASSRYLAGPSLTPQRCVLSVATPAAEGGLHTLETLDGVALSHASPQELQQHGLQAGDLARFTLDAAVEEPGEGVDGGEPVLVPRVSHLTFEGKCSARRALPDPWSKILFQSRHARGQGVTFEALLRAAEGGMDSTGEGT